MNSRQRSIIIMLGLCLAAILAGFGVLLNRSAEPVPASPLILDTPAETPIVIVPIDTVQPAETNVIPTIPTLTETSIPIVSKTSLPCPVSASGGLVTEMKAIIAVMPASGSEGFVPPTNEQMTAWELIVSAAAQGDLNTACTVIQTYAFPYQVVQFTDTPNEDREYILLREIEPVKAGWGTYIFNASKDVNPLVIEVPHPAVDWNTEIEGVEMFRKLDARALLVAGTDRCASSGFSACSGITIACGQVEPYRISDVAHSENNMFQAAHQALMVCGEKTVAIQLHVNSVANCPDVFVSNGTTNPGALSGNIFDNVAKSCGDYTADLADGSAGECQFTGGAAPQAVFTNSCGYSPPLNVCTDFVLRPTGADHFISIEQSVTVQKDFDCLVNALEKVFNPAK